MSIQIPQNKPLLNLSKTNSIKESLKRAKREASHEKTAGRARTAGVADSGNTHTGLRFELKRWRRTTHLIGDSPYRGKGKGGVGESRFKPLRQFCTCVLLRDDDVNETGRLNI